jgi:hypothetical protein
MQSVPITTDGVSSNLDQGGIGSTLENTEEQSQMNNPEILLMKLD